MDTARYFVAVAVWAMLPPAIAYWFVLHPFVVFWRRRGKAITFLAIGTMFVALIALLFATRERFLTTEFGTHWLLWIVGAASYALSIAIEVQCRKHLKFRTLAGVPEVEPDQAQRKLLDQGIYARVRHPRYLSVTFGMLAMTLFANYLALWVLFPLAIVSLYVIALLEERELIASLGRVYEDYRERVPMFVPTGRQSMAD